MGEKEAPGRSVAGAEHTGMSQDDKAFSVSDKRHFTADGRAREETAGEPERNEAAPESAARSPREKGPERAELGPFILSLGAQAAVLLSGQAPSPEGANPLDEARYVISAIEMLREKTEGRRTADEDRIIDGILYELRMSYVARARGGVE